MAARITVSNHAYDQARSRFFAEFSGSHANVCRAIVGEIHSAIVQGRMAVNLPRWAVRPGRVTRTNAVRRRGEVSKQVRFVWTPDERRVYVIHRMRSRVVAITCQRGRELLEAAA